MTRWRLLVRFLLTAAWVSLVALIAWTGLRRDKRLERLFDTATRQREQLRLRATDDILSSLLRERDVLGLPKYYRFTVYFYDPHRDLLVPVFPTANGPDDIRNFRPGCGATGTAFREKSLVLVTGDAVSDASYGLTPEQQQHWVDFRAVVATPIWVDGERPIGVLTAISAIDDGCFNEAPGQSRMRELADVIGVVIVCVSRDEVPWEA